MYLSDMVYFATNRPPGADGKYRGLYPDDGPILFRVGHGVVKEKREWNDPNDSYALSLDSLETFFEAPRNQKTGSEPVLGSKELFSELQGRMRREKRDLLIYIHGFANTFKSAMERARQLQDYWGPVVDQSRPLEKVPEDDRCITLAVCWPSDGKVFSGFSPYAAYHDDRHDAELSGLAIARMFDAFQRHIATCDPAALCNQKIHLVAHSMGVFALTHAVRRLRRIGAVQPRALIFDTAFLMAGDDEDDVLSDKERLAPLTGLSRRIYAYHSLQDLAVWKAASVIGGPRIGYRGPRDFNTLPDNVISVDCSRVSRSDRGEEAAHQYYRTRAEVLRDVQQVLAEVPDAEIQGRRADPTRPRRFLIEDDERLHQESVFGSGSRSSGRRRRDARGRYQSFDADEGATS
ncbi:MAG: alpha/beta hydrolase [Pseudomonadota bacterium]